MLRSEVRVGASLERTWAALLDLAWLSRALPGAALEPAAEGGLWRGTLNGYSGTARIVDADDDDRVATFRLEGREVRGHGSAAATITVRLAAADGATRVVVETDLRAPGRRPPEDAAGALLGELARRLERELRVPRVRRRAGLLALAALAAVAAARVVRRR
jgi:carbon monoxide dehydrogenase subunit G